MLSSLRARLEFLSRAEHDPGRTAAALALGVFLSFSPLLGLQIIIGMGVAVLLRLSRVAVLVGLCTNLPWIMLPWYVLTTAAAAAILGGPVDVDIRGRLSEMLNAPVYHSAFWGHTSELISSFLWPFVVGPTCGALVLGATAYVVAFRFLSRRQQRLKAAQSPGSPVTLGDAQERAADRHVHDSQRARLQP
jgi:uncharacterized protein (DUF2062 family)